MKTEPIKALQKECGIPNWKIAEILGVCDMTIYRWLRSAEIPDEQGKRIIEAVEALKGDTPND